MNKEVIYIDIEDDITSIIEKVKSASSKIVAVVPPKRATVFTSLVNLKLLKKAGDNTKKKVVLVSADDTITALAGSLDMYVAKNLTSPPEIPKSVPRPHIPSAVIQASGVTIDPTIEENLNDVSSDPDLKEKTVSKAESGKKGSSKLSPIKRLPDFNSFRKRLIIGGLGLLALLFIWWQMVFILPTAGITLQGQVSRVASEISLTTGPDVEKDVDEEGVYSMPSERKTIEITETVDATATGEENKGNKATGTLEIRSCDTTGFSLVSGTRFTHDSGLVYKSTESVTVNAANCGFSGPEVVEFGVEAEKGGGKYNIAETNSFSPSNDEYSVTNFSQSKNNTLTINGSDMGGGTDNIVKVLQQSDIDTAVDSITFDSSREQIITQLRQQFEGEVYIFDDTIKEKTKDPTSNPAVGAETDKAKVTVVKTFSALGVNRADFEEDVLKSALRVQVGEQQVVTDSGIGNLVINITTVKDGVYTLRVVINGQAGPDVDEAQLKEQIKGLRYSEAITKAQELPGIVKADIELSPVWVNKVPRNVNKIAIEVVDTNQGDDSQQSTEEASQTSQ